MRRVPIAVVVPEEREPESLADLQATHAPAPRSRHAVPRSEAGEHSAYRNYVRDLILGFNDGLVSVYAIVAGVAGAAFATREIAVAGLAAAVAGALSMGLGEYLSTKSQSDYYESEARREREHIRKYPRLEREEVREMLAAKDYPPEVVERMVDHITGDEERFVDFMMREEFGVGQESERSALVAMGLVMVAFVVGAILPVVAFFLLADPMPALGVASVLSLGGLFAAGAGRNVLSRLSWWRGGVEMTLLGAVAAAITYGVGTLFGVVA